MDQMEISTFGVIQILCFNLTTVRLQSIIGEKMNVHLLCFPFFVLKVFLNIKCEVLYIILKLF